MRSRSLVVAALAALLFQTLSSFQPAPAAAATSVGWVDHSYAVAGPDNRGTAEAAESKLWYTDGRWWSGMLNPADARYHIYWLDRSAQSWNVTATQLDIRNQSHADYLWSESTQKLYVVSSGSPITGSACPNADLRDDIRVYRYSYNASTDVYALDAGFPSVVDGCATGSATIALDSTGTLWITYQQAGNVMVSSSADGLVWASQVLPAQAGSGLILPDDISVIAAFDGQVGVLWTNHNPAAQPNALYFATRTDGDLATAWQVRQTVASGAEAADGHLSLKVPADGSGQLFAAVKTGKDGNPNTSLDLINLYVRDASTGAWTKNVVVTVGNESTRPHVVLDASGANVWVFYAVSNNGGRIYYKHSSTSAISFESGLGQPLIERSGYDRINDPTSSKAAVTDASGLVVMASDRLDLAYLHGVVSLPSPFVDIDDSQFRSDIAWLEESGITTGCTTNTFCAPANVTRGQMAAFLVRALSLPSSTTDYFTDDAGSMFESQINALRKSGITTGCGGTNFCPNANVTRGEMAAFLVRALDLPSSTTDYFTDDETSMFEIPINALAQSAITTGCTATTFCPLANVTRGQMAAFLHRALT